MADREFHLSTTRSAAESPIEGRSTMFFGPLLNYDELQSSVREPSLRPWNPTERGLMEAARRWCHKSEARRRSPFSRAIDSALLTNGPVCFASDLGKYLVKASCAQIIDEYLYGEPAQVRSALRQIVSLTSFVGDLDSATAAGVARLVRKRFALPPYETLRAEKAAPLEFKAFEVACAARGGLPRAGSYGYFVIEPVSRR